MSWAQLKAILDENRQIARDDARESSVSCPIDGSALNYNPKRGTYDCPMGNYTVKGRPPKGQQ